MFASSPQPSAAPANTVYAARADNRVRSSGTAANAVSAGSR